MNSEVIYAVESYYADAEKYKNIKNFTTGELIDELKRRLGDDAVAVRVEIGKSPDPP